MRVESEQRETALGRPPAGPASLPERRAAEAWTSNPRARPTAGSYLTAGSSRPSDGEFGVTATSHAAESLPKFFTAGRVMACIVAALFCVPSVVLATEAAPACARVSVSGLCDGALEAAAPVCRALQWGDAVSRGEGAGEVDRLAEGAEAIGELEGLPDRLAVGTMLGCRLLSLGAAGPARRALTVALNSIVAAMESEGRSGGVMEAIVDLIQVQFRAGFEDDAIRSMAVFDWAVRDSADRPDAARNLALGGTRLAEIGRRDLARGLSPPGFRRSTARCCGKLRARRSRPDSRIIGIGGRR